MENHEEVQIIGKGTWLDMIAHRVILREEKLNRKFDVLRTESGLGASGIPHVGSLGDAIRAYGIKLALELQGKRSEFIAFSDDMDGLRKVPEGMPDSLKKYLAHPVSAIPDPYNCHTSFSKHMNALLTDAMDKCGASYTFHSAAEDYASGLFVEPIRKILSASDRVGRIVKDEVGQEKYTAVLPFFPICASCGRIYTAQAKTFEPKTDKITYSCEGSASIKGQLIQGCGYKGETDIKSGHGKLPWKGEFAARWHALKINFEAHGKELTDSVRVNDRISEEILEYPAPFHVKYELFLDKGGRKISKSKSALEVITPQTWFRYAPPPSLNLLMFKRITGARNLGVEDIPLYVNELQQLEEIYFGPRSGSDEKELARQKGLFEYAHLLKPPANPSVHIPYNLLVYLVTVAPTENKHGYIVTKLREYGYLNDNNTENIDQQITYATNWTKDFKSIAESKIQLSQPQKHAIEDLIIIVRNETDERVLQNSIFNLSKRYSLDMPEFFRLLYTILLGSPRGPRLGPYIKAMGNDNVARALERAILTSSQKA